MEIFAFPVPAALDGSLLEVELVEAGVPAAVSVAGEELLVHAFGDDADENVVAAVIAAHVPPPAVEPTVSDKLTALGINVEELKALLSS